MFGNDVWYEQRPTNNWGRWNLATQTAPWTARSDMSVAAMPGTNCTIMVGGGGASGSYNDVWQSCDGIGAVWTRQTAAGQWWPTNNGAFVALFDGKAVGGSQAYSTLIYYPAFDQLMFSSTNAGVTWQQLGVAPWSYRTAAEFISDAESNVYMIGGDNYDSIAGDALNSLGMQLENDLWFSNTKGVTWYQIKVITSSAYGQSVLPSSLAYQCAFVNYQSSSSGLNGYHRQLSIVGGVQQVYSPSLQIGGQATYSTTSFTYSQCLCDAIAGIRAMSADLIFPGESTPTTNTPSSQSSGSSSKSYSPGATAGIAVGVAVGAIILTAMCFLCLGGALGGLRKSSGEKSTTGGSKRFEDETGTEASTNSQVEMGSAQNTA